MSGWRKIGRIWDPFSQGLSKTTHAALPVPILFDEFVRVIYSARDQEGRACGAWFDFRPDAPGSILDAAASPSLSPGRLGFFDDAGAMPSTAWWRGDSIDLLYVGWNLAQGVPFRNAIGLASSADGGRTFIKSSEGPLLDRSPADPAFLSGPFVLRDDRFRMWYASCIEWVPTQDGPRHRYHLKYAESRDGLRWRRDGHIAVDFAGEEEYAMSRPSVVRDQDMYRMWFSARGESYRIQYAESLDGRTFRRHSGISLDVSANGWDSQMTAYPAVFDWKHQRFMLYNGNDYGRTGIGLAVLE